MSKKKATAISLPLSRTSKIMASAVGVSDFSQDIVALATKATEIFLQDFARRAYDQSSNEEFRSNNLEYEDIQKLVHSDSRYEFLVDTIPKRIKFSEAKALAEMRNLERQEKDQIIKERILAKKQAAKEKAEKKLSEAKIVQNTSNDPAEPSEESILIKEPINEETDQDH